MKIAGITILFLLREVLGNSTQPNCVDYVQRIVPQLCIAWNASNTMDLRRTPPMMEQLRLIDAVYPSFNTTHFEQIPSLVKDLALHEGSVQEVLYSSNRIQSFRISNTNLMHFEVLESNSQLKNLSIIDANLHVLTATVGLLKGLEHVELVHCQLSYVSFEQFKQMENLTSLDLSLNKLMSIELKPDYRLFGLKKLSLHGNQLSYFNGFPESFPRLAEVSLYDNAWFCEAVPPMIRAAIEQNVTIVGMDSDCRGGESRNSLCCSPILNAIQNQSTVTSKVNNRDLEPVVYSRTKM